MTLRDIYPAVRTDRENLRVGVLLENLVQPRWVAAMIEALGRSGAGKVTTILRLPAQAPQPRACLAYRLYCRADAAYFSRYTRDGDGLAPVDIAPLVDSVPLVDLAMTEARQFQPADLTRLGQERLDVILWLATGPLPEGLPEAARYGVWRYHHGDGIRYRHGPATFWEMYDACPTTGALLQAYKHGGGGPRIVCRSAASTHGVSLYLNRQKPYLKSAAFVARALRALQRQGPAAMEDWAPERGPPESGPQEGESLAVGRGLPGNLDMLRLAGRILRRWLRMRWSARRGEWWFLALRCRPQAAPGEQTSGRTGEAIGEQPLAGFSPLPVPPGRFHADPFFFEHDGDTHLFFEDVDVTHGRGVVSHCRLDSEGKVSAPRVVLERPYHLSYPFVFRWNADVFMLPETGQNKTIELYRAQEFPHRWVLERTLLEGWRATDATLHCDGAGHWWMFATIDEVGGGGNWDELFLFHADSPLGPWQPHPRNPIQSDVRWARPGGRLFHRGTKLLRPAQDCATHYGSGLWLMEVLVLNESHYSERPLMRLGPEWLAGNRCLHHLDSTDRFEIIDGMRWRPGAVR